MVDRSYRQKPVTNARHLHAASSGAPGKKGDTPATGPARTPTSGQTDRYWRSGSWISRRGRHQFCALRAEPQEFTIADDYSAHDEDHHRYYRDRAGYHAHLRAHSRHRPTEDRHAHKVADR